MKVLTFTYVREDFVDMYPVGENLECGIKYINKVYPILKKIVKNKSINLWCTGSSGLILATLLMTKLYKNKIHICHVKKPNEVSHSSGINTKIKHYDLNIIIDDFIVTGDTVNRVNKELTDYGLTPDILIICYDNLGITKEGKLDFKPDIVIMSKEDKENE